MQKTIFPKYFSIDHEIYVEVKVDNEGYIIATNDLGSPWSPLKAIACGTAINQEEFEKGSKARREIYP